MKKELRGRRTKDYRIDYIADLSWITESDYNLSDEQITIINDEYGCDISGMTDTEAIADTIKKSILEMYNDAITPSVMMLYSFLSWYKKSVKKLIRLGKYEERDRLLDFDAVLDNLAISNLGSLLAQKYDKDDVEEFINHSKYKLISIIKARISTEDESELLDRLEQSINAVIYNCSFLHFIDEDYEVDNYYLLRWEYYPVDKVFRNVINTFDSEISRPAYLELKGKEFFYFDKIKKSEIDFSSIKSLNIVKDGKTRQVYIANKAID